MKKEKCNIKAVTFDLWETLIFERDGASSQRTIARCKSLQQALNKLEVNIPLGQMELALKETALTLLNLWETNRDVTHLDQIRFILKFAAKGSIVMKEEWSSELTSAYISPILDISPYLNPDARRVLEWLKKRNKSIGLVCNTGLTPGIGLRRLLAREDVLRYFDCAIFSDEIGIRKPDPRIFRLAVEKLKAKPCEVVHIGDNLKTDVWGAQEAGLKAIYLQSEEGRDKIAESDPTSLVSLSRRLGSLRKDQIVPDRTIASLKMVTRAVEELEA